MTDISIKEKVKLKLAEIGTFFLANKKEDTPLVCSLMGGVLGEIIFCFHYYQYTNDERYEIHAYNLLEQLFDNLGTNNLITYAGGFAGLKWTFCYLSKKGFIEADLDIMFEDIDEHIETTAFEFLEIGNYDFLHGAVGIAYASLYEPKHPKRDAFLKKSTQKLLDIGIEDANTLRWNDFDYDKKCMIPNTYNLGLSHGIPSILSFLVLVASEGILVKTLNEKIPKIVNGLMDAVINSEMYNCYFPYTVSTTQDIKPTRLAWCYGDLGVCCALYQAGSYLNDAKILDFVEQVLDFNTTRKDLPSNQVYDAGLCHGTAGLAIMYLRMYERTKKEIYNDSATYWYEATLQEARHVNGIAGYKAFMHQQNPPWISTTGFLEGIAGIGLSLLSYVYKETKDWEKILLI